MSENPEIQVGLITCGGEELPNGTLSRTAVRLVLEKYRPDDTVNLCFPFFLTGDEGGREFAASNPVITVDGCGKLCAFKSASRLAGKAPLSLNVEELLEQWGEAPYPMRGELDERGLALADRLAKKIAGEVDRLTRLND